MIAINASTVANIPHADAWARLSDISKAHLYVPGIVGTEVTTEQATGVGASRRVYNKRGFLVETVTAWQDGEGMTLHLTNPEGNSIAPIFSHAEFIYSMQAETDSTTRLSNGLRLQLRGGSIGSLLAPVLGRLMQSTVAKVALSQRLYYETGDTPGKAQLQALLHEVDTSIGDI